MSMHLSALGCYLLPNNTPQVGCIARLDEDTASLICRDQISTCMPKKDTWVNIENYMIIQIKLHISLSKTTSGKNKEINTPIDDQNYQSLSKSNAILTLPLYYLSEQKYSISLSE
jgi:hypothetical protein